jgi:hypothetical protein
MKYSIIIILAIFGIVPTFASNETTGVSMAAETYTTEKIPGLICEKV